MVIALLYFLTFSPYFWVKKIIIEGNEEVPAEEIENIAQKKLEEKTYNFIPQKSILFLPIDQIKEDILVSLPQIGSVDINKKTNLFLSEEKFSGIDLIVKIQERESVGVWCQYEYEEVKQDEKQDETAATSEEVIEEKEPKKNIGQCFFVDKEGVIYKKTPLISGTLVLNIHSLKKEEVGLGDSVVEKNIMFFILEAREELAQMPLDYGHSPTPVIFELFSSQDLRAVTSEGWQIYFNPENPVKEQVGALELVLEEEIKEKRSSLKYLDLRIRNRVYYQ